ncbi:Hypothetical predicted protein [Octopus vulgaris]|uniref:TRPM SLOG domain-containing protein n=1 Tax=Octopus vulgaris TaxID=6645 RepID=A0AA36BKV6_OCTVU|nr:Hypothetical predicted protein [Octopus vulgaris]
MQIRRGGGRRPVAMASSANGLELQEMAEESGQKPKQPETTETLIQAPLESICFDISLSSESSAEEDEESQIGGEEKRKLLKHTRKLELPEIAEVSGQKPKQPETTETQIQPPVASTSFDISPSSERNLESSAEKDSYSDKEFQTSQKWIKKNIKLRSNTRMLLSFQLLCVMFFRFVRVDHQTPMEIMMCLIRSTWNIRLPSLLISVIGGREDIQLNPHTEAVGRGLYKAARTIDAWIITEGLHTGVAKYIGEVMYKENKVVAMNEVTTLGIAPWNCVLKKKSLVNKGLKPVDYSIQTNSKEEMYALDPNHSHFILVDDGTKDNFGEIIEFRKKLEHTISQEKIPETEVKIPAVVVMVGGGPGTLKSVYDSISCNIPVVIVKDSGRAADIMAKAYQTKLENSNEEDEDENDRFSVIELMSDVGTPSFLQTFKSKFFLFSGCKEMDSGKHKIEFVRVDHQTPMDIIINLIIYQWDFSLPNLLISVIGGREDVQLNEPTKEALGHSLVKAARTTDAWIISEGLHSGVVKYIGEAISDNENKVADMKKVKTIGIARWNCVQNKESLVNKEGLWPANYSNGGEYALDPNHTHFILVDGGTNDTSGVERKFKKQLEDTILQNKRQKTTIPAVAVMVGGELETLKSAYDSLSRNNPVIIVKGSGKAADIMADVYEALLKEDEEGKDITERSILKQLKADIEKQQGANDLVDCVFDSMGHLDLITVCNIQSPEDFDIAIMKALFKDIELT